MRPAIMAGAMSVPVECIDLKAVKRDLTVKYEPMGEEPVAVQGYSLDGDYIHVPRQYGIRLCRTYGIEYEDHTSEGFPAHFPKRPTPREPQVPFINDALDATESYFDFICRAHTGFGKTISSLLIAADLGRTTLVIVDQENLRDQWIEDTLVALFGFKLSDVGVVQGKRCEWRGKSIVVSTIQTLVQKEFEPEFYDYFGTVIFDEVHVFGAPTFSRGLMMFSAMYRFGVSATPKRRDVLRKLVEWNLGPVRVAADKEHDESSVYFAFHDTVYSWYANISPKVGRFINEVSEDASRNLMIAESAIWMMETGRDVLILGDRIEHLRHIMKLCQYLGVDEDDLGLYAGYDPSYGFDKQAKPQRRPEGLTKHAETGEYEYTPLSLQLIAKRIPRKVLKVRKERAKILFATYGMFQKGVDESRLAAGADATPRSAAEQSHGRILREKIGKKMPIWFTICDWFSYRAVHGFVQRIADYVKSNARIYEWKDTGGIEEWDADELIRAGRDRVDRLKSMRIETNREGLNTLRMAKAVSEKSKTHASAIKEQIRSIKDSRGASERKGSNAKSTRTPSKSLPPSSRTPSRKRR